MAGVVLPGETLRATAWKQGDRFIGTGSVPSRDGAVALSDVEFIPA